MSSSISVHKLVCVPLPQNTANLPSSGLRDHFKNSSETETEKLAMDKQHAFGREWSLWSLYPANLHIYIEQKYHSFI